MSSATRLRFDGNRGRHSVSAGVRVVLATVLVPCGVSLLGAPPAWASHPIDEARITDIRLVPVDNSRGETALEGFLTHDIMIDFQGLLSGSQLVVELTSGSIYQHPDGQPRLLIHSFSSTRPPSSLIHSSRTALHSFLRSSARLESLEVRSILDATAPLTLATKRSMLPLHHPEAAYVRISRISCWHGSLSRTTPRVLGKCSFPAVLNGRSWETRRPT